MGLSGPFMSALLGNIHANLTERKAFGCFNSIRDKGHCGLLWSAFCLDVCSAEVWNFLPHVRRKSRQAELDSSQVVPRFLWFLTAACGWIQKTVAVEHVCFLVGSFWFLLVISYNWTRFFYKHDGEAAVCFPTLAEIGQKSMAPSNISWFKNGWLSRMFRVCPQTMNYYLLN